MIKLIKCIYIGLNKSLKNLRWRFEYKKTRYRYLSILQNKHRITSSLDCSNIGNVLVVIPHADDDLIGCYSIIEGNNNIYGYYIGDYPIKDSSLTFIRDNELVQFANSFNLNIIKKNSNNHVVNIKDTILNYKITTILTPDFNDWHPDHQKASKYVIDAIKGITNMPLILTYSITVPKPFFRNCLYSILSREAQEKKWNTFNKFYISQRFMPIKRFKFQEIINAIGIDGVYAAELFTPLSFDELVEEYKVRPTDSVRVNIRSLINDISKIRNYSDSRYNEDTL